MARSLTSSVRDQLTKEVTYVCLIAKFEFDGKTGEVRVWNGIGDLNFDGEVYSGIGNLGGISTISETSELKAVGMSFVLSGIPSSQISLALTEEFQQRRCSLWVGFFDESVSPGLLHTPVLLFRGRMDTMEINRGPTTSTVTINAENIFMALERAPMRRYMPEDHNRDKFADSSISGFTVDDYGFNGAAGLQDRQIYWGGPAPSV